AEEMDELVGVAEERDLVLMPGHLLLYHPGVLKLKELIDAGELGDVLCVYGNRQNLGIVRTNENALWSLGVHDLSVILYLVDEEPVEAIAHGRDFLTPGVEDVVFCYLRFPTGKIAPMHLSWLDPHKMRRLTVVGSDKMVVFDDMELERKVTVYDKYPWKRAESYGEWQTRSGDIHIPKIATDEPLKLECRHFLRLVAGDGDRSCVRERVTIGDDVVLGRGSLVENDTTIGSLTKIQADAYITAYSTLEDNVFVAPCVVTTNDNYMGRTERRRELIEGPTIRRGARIGGGAILCPGVEIGEEAFVGAGAVVIKDVPPRVLVVGNPARVLRDVPEGELLARDP